MIQITTREELIQLQKIVEELLTYINNLKDWKKIKEEMESKQQYINDNIWNNTMINIAKEIEEVNKHIREKSQIEENFKNLKELFASCGEEDDIAWIKTDLNFIKKQGEILLRELRFDHNDALDCFLEIHSGAGGADAQDWGDMLKKMYISWCEKSNIKYEIIDSNPGKECGIKNVLIKITNGEYLYGRLKSESGIHRLVRLSPFNAKRHTSFASVNVVPLIEKDLNIVINPTDLIIDTYRSSGAGGQHVNTTDSAVRITHKPTGIIAQSQKERSQHSNKETAMKLLKSRLLQQKLQEIEKKKQEENREKQTIGFGSQTRSYILHPYKLVKDHRTGYENSQVESILMGDINPLLQY